MASSNSRMRCYRRTRDASGRLITSDRDLLARQCLPDVLGRVHWRDN
jgi:hypothetical protein